MTIHWLQFLPALLLLWLPRQTLRWGARRRRGGASRRRRFVDTNPARNREPGDSHVSFRAEIFKLRNHVDFLRASLGSVALLGTFVGVEPAVGVAGSESAEAVQQAGLVQLAVLLVGVLVQMFRFEQRVSLYAPIFYLSGLTIGMCGWSPALFAIVLVWIINLALPGPAAFLAVQALLVLTFGVLFHGVDTRLPFFAAMLLFLPVVMSLLMRRRLGLFTKRVKAAG